MSDENLTLPSRQVDQKYCYSCGKIMHISAVACPFCGAVQRHVAQRNDFAGSPDRITAGIFAILLGGIGCHKFYLGQIGQGVIYLLFCWTAIPAIIAIFEGILYLTQTDAEFARKYGT